MRSAGRRGAQRTCCRTKSTGRSGDTGATQLPAGQRYDHKHVEADDAMAWARALEVAKDSPHAAAMIEARSAALADAGNAGSQVLPGVVDEFIAFAYGGAFEFADMERRSMTPASWLHKRQRLQRRRSSSYLMALQARTMQSGFCCGEPIARFEGHLPAARLRGTVRRCTASRRARARLAFGNSRQRAQAKLWLGLQPRLS